MGRFIKATTLHVHVWYVTLQEPQLRYDDIYYSGNWVYVELSARKKKNETPFVCVIMRGLRDLRGQVFNIVIKANVGVMLTLLAPGSRCSLT